MSVSLLVTKANAYSLDRISFHLQGQFLSSLLHHQYLPVYKILPNSILTCWVLFYHLKKKKISVSTSSNHLLFSFSSFCHYQTESCLCALSVFALASCSLWSSLPAGLQPHHSTEMAPVKVSSELRIVDLNDHFINLILMALHLHLAVKGQCPESFSVCGRMACLPSWNIFFLNSQDKALSFCLRASYVLNQTLKFINFDIELTSCATVTLLLGGGRDLPLPFHKLPHLTSWWLHTCSCSWTKTVAQSPFTLHIQSISELIWLCHDYDRLCPPLSSSTAVKLPSLHFWLIKRMCPLPHPISLLLSLLNTTLKAITRVILVKF